MMPGLSGIHPKLFDGHYGEHDHHKGKDERDQPGDFITAARTTDERARAPGEARGSGYGGRACHFMRLALLNQGDSLLLLGHDFLRQFGISQGFTELLA